jgi:hypothetical protein
MTTAKITKMLSMASLILIVAMAAPQQGNAGVSSGGGYHGGVSHGGGHYGGGSRGYGYHGGSHGYSRGYYGGGYRGYYGGHHHGYWGGGWYPWYPYYGFGFVFPPVYYGYPYYPGSYGYSGDPYPYANDYSSLQPDAYSEPEPQTYYWYYCEAAQAYYPYVKSCPGGWKKELPNPTPPGQ